MGLAGSVVTAASMFVLGIVTVAAAQGPPADAPPSPSPQTFVALSPAEIQELDKWISAMEKWQRYDAKWDNRPARDGWGRIAERRPPPDPPAWLEARCAAAAAAARDLEYDERTTKACRLLADPRATNEPLPAAVQTARMDAEKPEKRSSFLTRVHIDGLWTTASTSGRLYGLVGSHVTLVDVGRIQIFGPPGVLLLSVPDGNGSRRITLGYTWGVSVRLTDVRLFAPTSNMTLFFNVSKVWADLGEPRGKYRNYDMAGFSLAPRKKP